MTEDRNYQPVLHNLSMENREKLKISGVSDVDSFDDETVIIYTQMGELTVKGKNLQINSLSTEVGELTMQGNIVSLVYTDSKPKAKGFFAKVFR